MKAVPDAKGVYVIAPTPFHADGNIDESSIDRMCDFFVKAGVSHLTNKGVTGYAQAKGVPAAAAAVPASGVMLVVGGLLVLFSWHAIVGAALLVLFLVPAAFLIHNYWTESDPMMKANQEAHF